MLFIPLLLCTVPLTYVAYTEHLFVLAGLSAGLSLLMLGMMVAFSTNPKR